MQASSCFNLGCGKIAKFKCKCTSKGSFMCEDHKNQHLASLLAHNIEKNCEAKEEEFLSYLINEGNQLEQLLQKSIKSLEILSPSTNKFILRELKYCKRLEKEINQNAKDNNLFIFMTYKNQMLKQNLSFVSKISSVKLSDLPRDNFITLLLKIDNKDFDINTILGTEKASKSLASTILILKSAARGYLARKKWKQQKASQLAFNLDFDLATYYQDNLTIPRVSFKNPATIHNVPASSTGNAIKLQSVARGYLARQLLKQREKAEEWKHSDSVSLENKTISQVALVSNTINAIKLQSIARGYLARQRQKNKENGEECLISDPISAVSSTITTENTTLNETKDLPNILCETKDQANNLQSQLGVKSFSNEKSSKLSSSLVEENSYTGERNADGQRHGFGVQIWPNGSSYVGYWKNDKRLNGKHSDQSLTVYDGEWENDTYHGKGNLFKLKPNRSEEEFETKYEGSFYCGQMQGYGKYTWEDGSSYEGEFLGNQMNGNGAFKDRNGIIILKGMWKNGILVKKS
ncbi:unnamed protein product [Blepharisma stoltei]|uniref:Uncharacterized protein n=1 Tax=Blepharisma stoltei TaxID=1481888 RepID=A0AAU9IEJ8_9CILI|nr:unnamed protein product [Blepharisma stoltei]